MSPHLSYTLYKLIGHTFPLFSQSTKLKEREASEIFCYIFNFFCPLAICGVKQTKKREP